MKTKLIALSLLATATLTNQAVAAPPDPELLFNCDLSNGKVVVVRLNNDVPTYYYGSIDKVEMTLPKSEGDKTQVRAGQVAFSGGGASYYRFINGVYSYVVYSGIGKGWEFTGLKVYKNAKLLMKKECTNGGFLTQTYRGENLVQESDTGDDGTYGYAD
ncbi:hypothetical protein D3C75_175630 [compost metagenome]